MSEKPHAPTKRRLDRARASGDVALSGVLVYGIGLCAALLVMPGTLASLVRYFRSRFLRALVSSPPRVSVHELVGDVLMLTLPVLVVASAASLVAGLAQTGGHFAPRKRRQSAGRGPFGGAFRGFSFEAPLPLGVAFVGSIGTATAAVWLVGHHAASLRNTVGSVPAAAAFTCTVALRLAWLVATTTCVVGLTHFALASRARWHRLRLSEAELRREQRDDRGDPTLRVARRRTHRELLLPRRSSTPAPDSSLEE